MRTAAIIALLATATAAMAQNTPRVLVREAGRLQFPGVTPPDADRNQPGHVDCNSPAHWDGGQLYMFFSTGHPFRSSGQDLFHLSRPSQKTTFNNEGQWNDRQQGARWIEATYKAPGGKLYMWYHNEPHPSCGKQEWTAPRIGQMFSTDNGLNWADQGLILEARSGSENCESANRYFTGGNGDFCVNADHEGRWLYFYISTYDKDVAAQGVAVARMPIEKLDTPVGQVRKWHQGQWDEPGLGGRITPFIPVTKNWHAPDADAFWGSSIHWNTHLKCWVMLLNRAKDKEWAQEGIYACFSTDLGNPASWSKPVKILDAAGLEKSRWYPQVMSLDRGQGTDKLAGQTARLFVAGVSKWELLFLKPGEAEPASQPGPAQSRPAAAGFRDEGGGKFAFDTGAVRGFMQVDATHQGLISLVDSRTGLELTKGVADYGLLNIYRLLGTNARYGSILWQAPKTAALRPDGTLEVRYPPADNQPLELAAVFAWAAADTLDMTVEVTPKADLPHFEAFVGSYFSPKLAHLVYAAPGRHAGGEPAMLATTINPLVAGTYLAFPRDLAAARSVFDGRWDLGLHPVQWSVTRFLAGPLDMRHTPDGGTAVLLMCPPQDCQAIMCSYAMPEPVDGIASHYSTYFSLFGRGLKAAQPAKARLRMVVGKIAPEQAVQLYQRFAQGG